LNRQDRPIPSIIIRKSPTHRPESEEVDMLSKILEFTEELKGTFCRNRGACGIISAVITMFLLCFSSSDKSWDISRLLN
jgi:hypothetical protein